MADCIDTLISSLRSCSKTPEAITEILSQVTFDCGDLVSYLHFRDDFYSRNLVYRDDAFEVLILCWSPGQCSPIHDHDGSEGWLRVMAGQIEETSFCLDSKGELRTLDAKRVPAGTVTHINDQIALHCIGNPTSERAVTLHVYSPAIDCCGSYRQGSSEVKRVSVGNYTEYGKLISLENEKGSDLRGSDR